MRTGAGTRADSICRPATSGGNNDRSVRKDRAISLRKQGVSLPLPLKLPLHVRVEGEKSKYCYITFVPTCRRFTMTNRLIAYAANTMAIPMTAFRIVVFAFST